MKKPSAVLIATLASLAFWVTVAAVIAGLAGCGGGDVHDDDVLVSQDCTAQLVTASTVTGQREEALLTTCPSGHQTLMPVACAASSCL